MRNKTTSCLIDQSSIYLQGGECNDFPSENLFSIDPLHRQIYLFFASGKNQIRGMKCLSGLIFEK